MSRGRVCLTPDTNLTAIIGKLRAWATITPRTPVDLHELCFSYRSVGTMGLPRDIIEEVLRFHHKDLRTLKACSLTSRALFSAVRGLIHRRVALTPWRNYPPCKLVDRIAARVLPGRTGPEPHSRYLSMAEKLGLLGYAREVSINIGEPLVPETLDAHFPQFGSFTQIQTLKMTHLDLTRFLPTFKRYFAQFVPTLRSLHLPHASGGVHDALRFICNFPHLDDLYLPSPLIYRVVPAKLSAKYSPPLRGVLVLEGWISTPIRFRFLLKIPGGLHFRAIHATRVDKTDLEEILVGCSSTLEVLSFYPLLRKFARRYLPSCGIRVDH